MVTETHSGFHLVGLERHSSGGPSAPKCTTTALVGLASGGQPLVGLERDTETVGGPRPSKPLATVTNATLAPWAHSSWAIMIMLRTLNNVRKTAHNVGST